MNDVRIGNHVITEHGNGTVAAITDGCATTDILRYRVVRGDQDHWFYLDELIAIDNEPPPHHRPGGADTIAPAPTRIPAQRPAPPTRAQIGDASISDSDTSGAPTRWRRPMCR